MIRPRLEDQDLVRFIKDVAGISQFKIILVIYV